MRNRTQSRSAAGTGFVWSAAEAGVSASAVWSAAATWSAQRSDVLQRPLRAGSSADGGGMIVGAAGE